MSDKSSPPYPSLLDDSEIKRLIYACVYLRGEDGASEEELQAIVRWAEEIRFNQVVLEQVLDGEIGITWSIKDNDVVLHYWKDGDVEYINKSFRRLGKD